MSHHAPIERMSEPRFLDEVGYFLYYEKEMRWDFPDYNEERRVYSRYHLQEVLEIAAEPAEWIRDKRVINIGAGCSCAVMAWDCRAKVSIDPLLDVYQNLGMLLPDEPGTVATQFVAASAEQMPLIQDCADLAYCRNALNHMERPDLAVRQIARIVRRGGFFYLDVDLDGIPTPDEPVAFSAEELWQLLEPWFERCREQRDLKPFSVHSPRRIRMFLRRNEVPANPRLDKQALFADYVATFPETAHS